jgi:hypothetical protein
MYIYIYIYKVTIHKTLQNLHLGRVIDINGAVLERILFFLKNMDVFLNFNLYWAVS